jgi:hypothetical protein
MIGLIAHGLNRYLATLTCAKMCMIMLSVHMSTRWAGWDIGTPSHQFPVHQRLVERAPFGVMLSPSAILAPTRRNGTSLSSVYSVPDQHPVLPYLVTRTWFSAVDSETRHLEEGRFERQYFCEQGWV